jgi:hypothetical protein
MEIVKNIKSIQCYREDLMTDQLKGGFGSSCSCGACAPSSVLSRRQFLSTGTAGAVGVAAATASAVGTAGAFQP